MNTANTPAFVKVNSTSQLKALSQGMAIFVVGIGCLGFVGWLFDVAILKSLIPGWATMKSNTAVLFILSGILLWMQNRENHARWIIPIGTLIILLVSTLTLGEYLFHVDIRIDQLLFKDHATNVLYPGRMSPITAFSFFLISLSFIALYLSYENRVAEYSVLSVFWISMLALIGYLYGASSLYKIGAYSSMAVHTATSFLVLSVGILFARPDRGMIKVILDDTAGGYILRKFLPVTLVFPVVLGWIRLIGQQMELYDTAFGLALMVIALITTMTIFVWINAQQLTNLDEERRQAKVVLSENEQKYILLFDKSTVPAAVLKLPEIQIIDANEAMEKLTGYTKQEMYGKTAVDLGLVNPVQRKQVVDRFEAQGSLTSNEIRIYTKSGDEHIVFVNTNPLQLGGKSYAVSTMLDITERKHAETKILQLNIELEQKVAQRTAELAEANQHLHQLSILDELTGLYNRRGFFLLAEEQLLLARRTESNLLVFYTDLDGLKQINDKQGHDAGDKAIMTVAHTLNKTFRASDIKARLGGDEFIILAIEAKELDTSTLLARLQERLSEHGLSMSIGVITIDSQENADLTDLITHADDAMYKIKMQKPGHR